MPRETAANPRRVRALDPDNRRRQHLEVIARLKAALALRLGEDLEGGIRQESEVSVEMATGLNVNDPTEVDWQRELASAYLKRWGVPLDLRRIAEACATVDAAPLLQELRRQNHESPELIKVLAGEAPPARDAKAR